VATTIHESDTANLPRLLSIKELSRYLDVPVSSIYRWRSEGRGPLGFKVGKEVRFRETDVLTWLEQLAVRNP